MSRYAVHPDYPPGCVNAPAGYRQLSYNACGRWRWQTTPCTGEELGL